MCRFLLAKSKENLHPKKLLAEFASMCQKSQAPDGDWQGDGWGIAWQENATWKFKKSLLPIWKEHNIFAQIPKTTLFVVHARSAGFPQHKNNLEFNQPYLQDNLCFVFNGMIRGVKIPKVLDGQIGAQKIFSFVKEELKHNNVENSLKNLDKTIIRYSRLVEGMNVGLVVDQTFYILCEYSRHPSYFSLRYFQNSDLTLVCSEMVADYQWKSMTKGEIRVF